jgi:hypothetical protein
MQPGVDCGTDEPPCYYFPRHAGTAYPQCGTACPPNYSVADRKDASQAVIGMCVCGVGVNLKIRWKRIFK